MGYDVHITRSPHWADGTKRITIEEWRRISVADPDLEVYDSADVELDPQDPELAYRIKGCDFDNCFYYSERTGTINIRRGYFEETLRKALEIATKLGAVVQGDEGEFYWTTESGPEATFDRPEPNG